MLGYGLLSQMCAFRRTNTCGDCDISAGLTGAVLMAGCDRNCISLLTEELGQGAVRRGSVACAIVPVFTHGDDVVCFSHRRGAPGHQSTFVFTGSLSGHVCGRTRL